MASILETLDIEAPVEVSYALWRDVAEWPGFLRHIERVEKIDDTRFKWWVSVVGADREFVAELTEVAENERIAWHTIEGVEHAGVVTFHYVSPTTSRVALQIEYEPDGFLEQLGALTNLTDVLANYDLGELAAIAEQRYQSSLVAANE